MPAQRAAVGETNELERQYVAARTLHARGKLLMPGFINAHTHVAMAYFKGLADDLLLQAWLQDHIWPAEGRLLNDSFVYDASLHGAAEMLRGGTTTFCDMYFFEAATARACADIGIRAHLGEGVLSFPVHGHAGAADEIAYNVRNAAQHGPDDLIRFELAPHAIYTCNEADLRAVAEASQQHNLRVHIHLSETQGEVDDCQKQHGKRPVHYLNELGLVNERLEHCPRRMAGRQRGGAAGRPWRCRSVVRPQQPQAGSRFAPVKLYERHGVRLTLARTAWPVTTR
jgi:5-methylthioadenosine/S-adenosylhomocysteine deaminase